MIADQWLCKNEALGAPRRAPSQTRHQRNEEQHEEYVERSLHDFPRTRSDASTVSEPCGSGRDDEEERRPVQHRRPVARERLLRPEQPLGSDQQLV